MDKIKDIRLRLYLDGIEFPIRRFSRVDVAGGLPVTGSVILPFSVKLLYAVPPRTMVHVFWQENNKDRKLLFEGEVSGRPYSKSPSGNELVLSVVSYLGTLNHLPTANFQFMKSAAIPDAANKFYGLDTLADAFTTDRVIDASITVGTNYRFMSDLEDKGVWAFISKYLGMAFEKSEVSGKPLVYHSYYANKRLRIGDGFFALNDKHLKNVYEAKFIAQKIVGQINNCMSGGYRSSLNEVIDSLKEYGYTLISIASPAYVEARDIDKAASNESELMAYAGYADEELKKEATPRDAYSPRHVFLPVMTFCRPPACNVFTSDRTDTLAMNSRDYRLTRLLNRYQLETAAISADVAYPPQVEEWRKEHVNKNDRLPLTEYEKKYGMIAMHQDKSRMYARYVARESDRTEDVEVERQQAVDNFKKADTETDFYTIRYRDTLEYTTPRLLPEAVAGLPGMVYDENGYKYYGYITRVAIGVDQDGPSGGVSTSIQMTNVLRAEAADKMNKDVADMAGIEEEENDGILPISPFLDRNMLAGKIDELYQAILGCESFNYNIAVAPPRQRITRRVITYKEYLDSKGIVLEADGRVTDGNPNLSPLSHLTAGNHPEDSQWEEIEDYIKSVKREIAKDQVQSSIRELRKVYGRSKQPH